MSNSYWNEEDDENIICPYCGEEYEPSYEDTYIGDDCVNCYTEDTNTYTCDKCGKKFIVKANITYDVSIDKTADFDTLATTSLYKDRIVLKED